MENTDKNSTSTLWPFNKDETYFLLGVVLAGLLVAVLTYLAR